jgi:hypothetical protein
MSSAGDWARPVAAASRQRQAQTAMGRVGAILMGRSTLLPVTLTNPGCKACATAERPEREGWASARRGRRAELPAAFRRGKVPSAFTRECPVG